MKKILIVHGSAGDGHRKAALAIYEELHRLATPQTKITLIDALDYTNKFFKFTYRMGYIFLVKYMPTVWGFVYYILDTRLFFKINQPLRVLTNTLNTRKLIRFLKHEKFDVCISTHFLSTEVISRMKREGSSDAELITVVTDFKSHLFWLTKEVDKYVVGSQSTKQDLISRGIESDKISAYGIPIEKKFSQPKNRTQLLEKLKLEEGKFTVLVMGGGFGVGPIKEVVMQMQGIDKDFQILVVCGHNKTLLEELTNLKSKFNKTTLIHGYCNNMDEMMFVSDIMVSKVGGLSSSESLACNLPIIAISPIPGQEMRNAKFLLDNGVGFKIRKPQEVNAIVSNLISNKSDFQNIKEKISELAKPDSAENITKMALK